MFITYILSAVIALMVGVSIWTIANQAHRRGVARRRRSEAAAR